MGFRELLPNSVSGLLELLVTFVIAILVIVFIYQKGFLNLKIILIGIALFLIINPIIVKIFGIDNIENQSINKNSYSNNFENVIDK